MSLPLLDQNLEPPKYEPEFDIVVQYFLVLYSAYNILGVCEHLFPILTQELEGRNLYFYHLAFIVLFILESYSLYRIFIFKKQGFYAWLIVRCLFLAVVYTTFSPSFPSAQSSENMFRGEVIWTLIEIAVLWGILQIKNNKNVKAWEVLA